MLIFDCFVLFFLICATSPRSEGEGGVLFVPLIRTLEPSVPTGLYYYYFFCLPRKYSYLSRKARNARSFWLEYFVLDIFTPWGYGDCELYWFERPFGIDIAMIEFC